MTTNDLLSAPVDLAERAGWAQRHTVTPYLPHDVVRQDLADGSILLTSAYDLPPVARNTGDWLHEWAQKAPDRIAVSERTPDGEGWRDICYGQLLAQVRAVGAALLARGLSGADRIAMLSGNSLDHLILSLAAQYVGVPVVPLAEQYSLIPEARERLTYILNKISPKLVFARDATQFSQALSLPELQNVEVVCSEGEGPGPVTRMADLVATPVLPDLDVAHAQVGPETLAKILFTSGSSSDPKGVLTTHRMLCVNQAQLAAVFPFLTKTPPRLTDWLPWNHVFGGNHDLNMVLAHGGTLTIDGGSPTKKNFATSLKNWIDRPGSLAFNVPVGFGRIVEALADDPEMRRHVFKDVDLILYSGASLPQGVWESLERYCLEARGGLPLMVSGWGMTETAPACLNVHEPIGRSGVIGVPLPAVLIKLIPYEPNRFEIRVKGPNVMPGYYEEPERTAAAFDAQGYLITGDAVRFVDPDDVNQGLVFDGRISEDFKLDTGTWVQAGTLRLKVLEKLAGLVQDVVICGHDRGEIGLFVFPLGARQLDEADEGVAADPALAARIATTLRDMNAQVTGSAKRITRAILVSRPPSIEGHEITDKGSLNVRNILARRAAVLERLYDDQDPAVIHA